MYMNMMRKMMYFGLGAMSLTREKAEKVFSEMAEKGDISSEEAKQFVDEAIKKGEEERIEMRKVISEEIDEVKKNFSLVTRSEFEALEQRIKDLEQKLQQE
ncbi:MAG: hypothetical protein PHX14_08865 [Syntrophomonadaceae bacterium]|nr:hypothetical protein [Syntrophomonadaceae bacterium]